MDAGLFAAGFSAMPVKLLGFHTHIGSQITDLAAYQLVLGKLIELGTALRTAGQKFEVVNIGGGFPVSYVTQEEWDEILRRIRDGLLAAKASDPSKIYLWGNALGGFAMGPDGVPTTTWRASNDLLKWMKWHLDRFNPDDAETRTLDHALYLNRDGLKTVSGMDESGHMDALGLAWIGMMAKDDRPFILQKAGGLQGTFTYIAFAPARNAAVFIAVNKFDFGAAFAMGQFGNALLEQIAPR